MKYGMLTVEREDVGKNRFNQRLWLCRCDCGAPTLPRASSVLTGRTRSCGCLQSAGNRRTHGQRALRSKAYAAWCNMKNRCDSPKNRQWNDYGGRGITYDPRWKSFEHFIADMGDAPVGRSLDRIDNDKGYSKKNCRWADISTQRRNKRPESRGGRLVWVEIDGERMILIDAVKRLGVVPYHTAVNRIHLGWDPLSAASTPYTRGFKHTPSTGVRYEYKGKRQTLTEWARETGIGRVTILKRLQRGWPIERALTEEPAY